MAKIGVKVNCKIRIRVETNADPNHWPWVYYSGRGIDFNICTSHMRLVISCRFSGPVLPSIPIDWGKNIMINSGFWTEIVITWTVSQNGSS